MVSEDRQTRCLVLLRSAAALDHMAPLIDRLARAGRYQLILCDIGHAWRASDDPLMRALTSALGLPHTRLSDRLPSWLRAIDALGRRLMRWGRCPGIGNSLLKAADRCFGIVDRALRQRPLRALLGLSGDAGPIDLLLCDRHDGWRVRAIVDLVHHDGGRSLCLPHSAFIWGNLLRDRAMLDPMLNAEDLSGFLFCERVPVTSVREQEQTPTAAAARDRLPVLGSMRFSPSWCARRETLLPGNDYCFPSPEGDKVRVLFLSPKVGDNVHWEEVVLTQRLLSQDGGFVTAFKAPLQSSRAQVAALKRLRLPRVHVVGEEAGTADLVRWADVVMTVSTSVLFEAYLQDKPLVYLRYLHFNRYFFEGHPALWTLDTRDDLFTAMDRIRANRTGRPYSADDVRDLLSQTVLPPTGADPVDETMRYIEAMLGSPVRAGADGPDRP